MLRLFNIISCFLCCQHTVCSHHCDNINYMKKMFVYANISLPILAGSLLYYVTSPQVMFVQNIDRLLGVSLHVGTENTFVVNLRSYMPDMLWAYALVFSLMLVTGNKTADVWKMFVIAGMFSTIMEVLQVIGCVKGTFDVMDIIVEIIAELMAVFIIKRHDDMRRKSYEKNQEVHRGTAVSDSICCNGDGKWI